MLKRNMLAIELGSSHIKIGLARYAKGIVNVEEAFIVDLPEQIYSDGKILEAEVMRSKIFNEIVDRGIKAKEVYLTINGSNVITREIILPDVKDEELDEMITYEIQQYMPINLEEYHIEYKILERFESEEQTKIRILVAAVSKEDVDSYYKFLLGLQLKPLVMDINGNAISKLFKSGTRVNGGEALGNKKVALIDLGSKSINVTVVGNGIVYLSRMIEAEEELNQIKAERDYIDSEVLNALGGRIKRVFQFYVSRYAGSQIDQVLLFGGLSNDERLVQHLLSEFTIPVAVIHQLNTVEVSGKSKSVDLKRYLNMLGCLARDKQVN